MGKTQEPTGLKRARVDDSPVLPSTEAERRRTPSVPRRALPATRPRVSRWAFALLVPVCAVAPWAVPWPWQHDGPAPVNDPAAIIALARSQAVTGRAETQRPPAAPGASSVQAAAATARQGYDLPVSAAELAAVKTTPGPYEQLGRVAIPRVGLNVTFGEGVAAKTLDKGPGHWPGTPLPGATGNAVLSGHRSTHTAPFRKLNLLKRGDKIVVTLTGKHPLTYRVRDTTIVPEAKFKAFVVAQPTDPSARMVTLFACHPAGSPVYRIVVRADVEPG